jgi:8-oxo-dGTP pyrophosphatase MutT (NUDIX family)
MQYVEREAVRAILMTPANETLLMRVRPPGGDHSFWVAPGGGMVPGEDVVACLRRELREELGLESYTLGPLVWRRQHTFNWGERRICQRERYYVVTVEKFSARMLDPIEAQTTEHMRWWTVDELASTPERLTPLSLASIVAHYLREGAPREPLDIEVLVD